MIEAVDLTFGYDRDHSVLTNWNETFVPGEVAAITGPSGRGKSTLLYLLGLMLKPSSGQVLFDGTPVAALRDRERARLRATRFGFVFQDAALDPSRTVLDNVVETALYRGESRSDAVAKAHQLLDRFGVSLRADAKPGQVSGGQAQRIALTRALLHEPSVLLADEPTGNLDPDSANVVIEAFHGMAAKGSIVIIVTHDPALVARCDREVRL